MLNARFAERKQRKDHHIFMSITFVVVIVDRNGVKYSQGISTIDGEGGNMFKKMVIYT